jgi:FOG: CheY-like receiver
MTEEQQLRLFKPFEQADGSISRKFGGTGLGLAISKRIMEKMGGSISVFSTPGQGSTFTLDVAVPNADAETEAQGVSGPAISSADAAGIFKGVRVLLAEDVELNREIAASLLEYTGVELVFACDGEEAVAAFSEAPETYALILMDVQMPLVDGYEATSRIRASGLPGLKQFPIIAMTANVFREDIEKCLNSGMNDHLAKPIDETEVMRKLETYRKR